MLMVAEKTRRKGRLLSEEPAESYGAELRGTGTHRTVRACSSIGAPETRPAGTRFSSLPSWTCLGTGVKVLRSKYVNLRCQETDGDCCLRERRAGRTRWPDRWAHCSRARSGATSPWASAPSSSPPPPPPSWPAPKSSSRSVARRGRQRGPATHCAAAAPPRSTSFVMRTWLPRSLALLRRGGTIGLAT